MDSKIIDGKALALEHQEKLKEIIKNLKITPHMVSFYNPLDPASVKFTSMKQKAAADLNLEFEPIELTRDFTSQIVATLVKEFNFNPKVHGIMFQLPLPETLNHQKDYLINTIRSDKDVDGLTGRGKFLPATTKGVFSILEAEDINLLDILVAVVGSEGVVGKSLVKELQKRGVDLIEIDQKNPGTDLDDLKDADLIISCTGVNNLIKASMIKDGVVLIDVGSGDFDPNCFAKAAKYTESRGGVGPMTVISLMENLVEAAQLHSEV